MNKKISLNGIKITALLLMAILLFEFPVQAAALRRMPYATKTFYVGSTYVTAEVGYNNGTYAYASVSASSDVDVEMKLVVYYNDTSHTSTKTFYQKTYGDVGYTCSSTISRVECYFSISSSDGNEYLYLGT